MKELWPYIDFVKLGENKTVLHKLIYENCSEHRDWRLFSIMYKHGLINGETVSEFTKGFKGDNLILFPKVLVTKEHILNSLGGSHLDYLKYFPDLIDQDVADEIIKTVGLYCLNDLPQTSIRRETVVNEFAKLCNINQTTSAEILERFTFKEIGNRMYKIWMDERRSCSRYCPPDEDLQILSYFE